MQAAQHTANYKSKDKSKEELRTSIDYETPAKTILKI
jgi:hypothetical protein